MFDIFGDSSLKNEISNVKNIDEKTLQRVVFI